jgi:hypothetical protein
MVMLSVAGMFITVINLRSAGLWLLRLTGRSARGVVSAVEVVTSPEGVVLRRPRVTYRAADGRTVEAVPAVFRKRSRLVPGSPVTVSHSRWRPTRIVVHGFDVRPAEPLYALFGLAIVAAVTGGYFHLWP